MGCALVLSVVFHAQAYPGSSSSAAPQKTLAALASPVPPAEYVIPGRTFDPSEAHTLPTISGHTYYVAITGNDANPGTDSLPFRTVQKGFDALKNGGDAVLIHGGLYRENVVIMNKDAPSGGFIVGPADDGEVIIDGSTKVTGWTAQSGNVYLAHAGFAVAAVVADNHPLYKELSVAGLQAAPAVAGVPVDYRYYYDSSAQNLYVRVAGGDPETHDMGVISSDDSKGGIYLWESNNYFLYGLTERFAGGYGISFAGCNNVTAKCCKVVFNGKHGLSVGGEGSGHDGANAQFIKNFVYFNFMQNWPRNNVWGGWGEGLTFQGTSAGLADGNISMKNGGEGIGVYDNLVGGTIFRNNVSADNWSCDFYIDNVPDGLIEGNLAVGHAPDPADWYNGGILPSDPTGDYFKVVQLSRPAAIYTGDESYGIGANLNNTTIRNNVIINARCGTSYGAEGDATAKGGLKNLKFINNTILLPTMSSLEAGQNIAIGGICIPYNNGNNTGCFYENNIIMGGSSGAYAIACGAFDIQAVPAGNRFLGLTIDHNLVYTPSNATPFIWNGGDWGTFYTHAQWLALAGGTGHGTGDVLTNPMLIDASDDSAPDKKPRAGSPAIDAGTALPAAFNTIDFLNEARPQGAGWDIGAFETAAASLKDGTAAPRTNFTFFKNYPNPFNSSTTISYHAPSTGHVRLTIHDISGRQIRVLCEGMVKPGSRNVLWNGKDSKGRRVAGGVYFCQMETESGVKEVMKMTFSAKQ